MSMYLRENDEMYAEFQHNCRYRILDSFKNQLDMLRVFIHEKSIIQIGTLGPQGTTSYHSALYLIDYIKELKPDAIIEIKLWDNFDSVYNALLSGEVNLITVPNAYERITEMYWDPGLKNLFSYLLETPSYGLAARTEANSSVKKDAVKIATCKPVVCLVSKLIEGIIDTMGGYEVILANSTTKAAEMVMDGLAEYAVTNETSIKDKDLEFISGTFRAEVLWSVFCKKYEHI